MSHRRGRRGVGVGRSGASKYAQKKADEMKAVSLQSALDTVEKLEVRLTDFAKEHQSEIQTDPVFRQRFLQMCAPLGVDPLASKKSFFGQMFNFGDFYHELAVKVAEVCFASRSTNGGIMSITEVQKSLSKRKTRMGMAASGGGDTNAAVSPSDIQVAIQKLSKLGGGFRTIEVGKSTMIVSVPTELDNDHMEVMSLAQAQSSTSGLTKRDVRDQKSWNKQRTDRSMELLLQEGMAWLDTHEGEDYYWFPSVWQESQQT